MQGARREREKIKFNIVTKGTHAKLCGIAIQERAVQRGRSNVIGQQNSCQIQADGVEKQLGY